jgi:hypothetical protein
MPDCARFQSSAYIPKVGDIIHTDHIVTKEACAFVYIVCNVTPGVGAPVLLAAPLRNPLAAIYDARVADLSPIHCTIAIGGLWHLAGPNPPRIR